VLAEGFGWEGRSEAAVDEAVRDAAGRLEKAGATVGTVSVPLHQAGLPVWFAIGLEGATELMLKGHGMGTNWKGAYTTSLLDTYRRGLQARPTTWPTQ
jgi:amidase